MEAVVWGMAHKRLIGQCGVGCGAGTLQAWHGHLACTLTRLQAWAGKCRQVQSQGAFVCGGPDLLTQPAHWASQAGHGRCGHRSATVTQPQLTCVCLHATLPQPQLTGLAKLGMGIAGTIAQTVGSASAPEDIDALAGESLHSL